MTASSSTRAARPCFRSDLQSSNSYNANYNYNYDEGFSAVPDFGGGSFGFLPGRKHFRDDGAGHNGRFRSLRGPQP